MKYLAILVVCFSFPCFAALHAVSRSAKFAYHTAAKSPKAGKTAARDTGKVVRFAARQVF